MNEINTLNKLRQCFANIIPEKEGRTNTSPLEYVIGIIFCYLGDTECTSLEAIRRSMKNLTQKNIYRNSFWERLSRKRITGFLKAAITELLRQFGTSIIGGGCLLERLGVSKILVVDSSYFSLWDGSKDDFPGTGTTAGIKWHAGFNILTGKLHWFELTQGSTHDRKCFPDLESLRFALIIVDLGYWDFNLLWDIKNVGGFFLSRIKSNAVIYITKIVQGKISQKYIGSSLLSVPIKRKRSNILEVMVEKVCDKGTLCCRAVGFWNPVDRCYHWYMTNLKVAAHLIYPLYRYRLQIELIFKACKQSLNANRLTSNNSNIIENLLLASIVAHLASHTILDLVIPQLTKIEQLAISVQRTAKVAVLLTSDFFNFLVNGSKKYAQILLNKIMLFADEIFDPNYRHRDSSLARLSKLLDGLF